MKFFLALIFLLLSHSVLLSQVNKQWYDSSTVQKRLPDQGRMEEYRSDPDFQYQEVASAPGIFDRFKEWLLERLVGLVGNENAPLAGKILLAALLAAVCFWVIRKLIRMDSGGQARQEEGTLSTALTFEGNDRELERVLREAIEKGHFEEATRYALIHALRVLGRIGALKLKSDKTNSDYVGELSGSSYQSSIGTLSYYFDYSYYGNFSLKREDFDRAYHAYQNITKEAGE